MPVQQGEIYEVIKSLWIVVDSFHSQSERYQSVHCAPILSTQELRLELDVPVAFQQGFVSLGLMEKLDKKALVDLRGFAHPNEVGQLRRNLVTWFSYYTFIDLNYSDAEPAPSDGPRPIHPGTILSYKKQRVCVIDHWGCFSEYPLLYVAPVVSQSPDPSPLDVDISSRLRDLFSDTYYVRAGEFFLAEREVLEEAYGSGLPLLPHGLVHKISRVMALQFGQLGLLL